MIFWWSWTLWELRHADVDRVQSKIGWAASSRQSAARLHRVQRGRSAQTNGCEFWTFFFLEPWKMMILRSCRWTNCTSLSGWQMAWRRDDYSLRRSGARGKPSNRTCTRGLNCGRQYIYIYIFFFILTFLKKYFLRFYISFLPNIRILQGLMEMELVSRKIYLFLLNFSILQSQMVID